MEPSFDAEFIRNTFYNDENAIYNEDLRGRLASSPVFEEAQTYEREFQTTRLKKEDFFAAWNGIQRETILTLDEASEEQGLIGENVTLRGEGIRVPTLDVDFSANIAMLSLLDKEKQRDLSFSHFLEKDEYRGKFAGFTVHFVEAEEEDVYIPTLAYRVSMNVSHSPFMQISLFATGDVAKTLVNFSKDARIEGSIHHLNLLFELCPDKAEIINRINMTLAESDMPDASAMRHVGLHAEKLINGISKERRPSAEDALVDLVAHYVDKESSYQVRTRKVALSENDTLLGTEYLESEDAPYALHNQYLDIVFRNQAIKQDNKITYRDRRTIQMAFPFSNKVAYVLFVDLDHFEKQ